MVDGSINGNGVFAGARPQPTLLCAGFSMKLLSFSEVEVA